MTRFAPLQLQRVNRALASAAWRSQESRRYACKPMNYHSDALEAMNSVRKVTIMPSSTHQPNLKQHCFLTAPLPDISKASSRGGAASRAKHYNLSLATQLISIQNRLLFNENCNAYTAEGRI